MIDTHLFVLSSRHRPELMSGVIIVQISMKTQDILVRRLGLIATMLKATLVFVFINICYG